MPVGPGPMSVPVLLTVTPVATWAVLPEKVFRLTPFAMFDVISTSAARTWVGEKICGINNVITPTANIHATSRRTVTCGLSMQRRNAVIEPKIAV
ncbi:MAG: hypothetical protein ACRC9K_04755 [Afipia sp.]